MSAVKSGPVSESLPFSALQQAADWYARLQDDAVDEGEREQWRRWLDTAADHRAAWGYVEQVSRQFAPLQGSARAADSALTAASAAARGSSRRQVLRSLAVIAAAGACGWDVLREGPVSRQLTVWRADYRTAVGEVRKLELADGSRLWLNSASALNVAFDNRLRGLNLLDGEMLLQAAQEPRPLEVRLRDGRMRVLGTRLSVRQQAGFTDLAVYEGRVELRNDTLVRTVNAGQQVRFNATRIDAAQPAPPSAQLWSRGLLMADGMSLQALLAELGRYRRGYLAAAPEVAALRVMGTFPLNDIEQVFALLEQVLPVRVNRILPWWTTIERR